MKTLRFHRSIFGITEILASSLFTMFLPLSLAFGSVSQGRMFFVGSGSFSFWFLRIWHVFGSLVWAKVSLIHTHPLLFDSECLCVSLLCKHSRFCAFMFDIRFLVGWVVGMEGDLKCCK